MHLLGVVYIVYYCSSSELYLYNKAVYDCSGLELYSYNTESRFLRLVETKKMNISWYIYTHESRLVLLASGMQCKSFTGYQVGHARVSGFKLPVFLSWLCSYFRAIDNLIREFIVISSMPFMLERSLKASQEIN